MLASLRKIHLELQSRAARFWRAREVVKVLSTIHAKELAETPVNQWAVTKRNHAKEIAAVKAGQFNIVDRRSWQYPYIPEALHRLNQPILKNTPYNIRRFTETPIPRRALNLVKDAIVGLKWKIVIDDKHDQDDPELLKHKDIAEYVFSHPNNVDTYRTLMEAVVEDYLTGGYGCIEPQLTPDYKRPMKMWPVDGSTIRVYADWSEGAAEDRPKYAQLTGLKGERGTISFMDDELVYIRENVRSSTPFGLGRMEVAFLSVNAFLGAQDMATRAGADQVHKTWLWWTTNLAPAQHETVRRHIQNEAEGQAKISMLAGAPKPEVIEVQPVTPEDLLLDWQEFLIRMIAAAFHLSPMALGLERDVNRNTGEVMAEQDFNSAVVPAARKIEEALTKDLLHKQLGWKELKFEFIGLEDPDEVIQTGIARQLYTTNSITPDEIRDLLQIGPDLPGGWGKLTMAQMALITAAAVGKQGMSGGGTGLPSGAFSGGGGLGQSSFGGGSGNQIGMNASSEMSEYSNRVKDAVRAAANVQSLSQSPFSAEDVSKMDPQTLELYRQAGLVPQDPNQLMSDMESQQPGILQTLSEELLEYFEWLDQIQEAEEDEPAEVTPQDMKEQQKKFQQRQKELQREERLSRNTGAMTGMYQNKSPQLRGPLPKGKKQPKGLGTGKSTKNYSGRTR